MDTLRKLANLFISNFEMFEDYEVGDYTSLAQQICFAGPHLEWTLENIMKLSSSRQLLFSISHDETRHVILCTNTFFSMHLSYVFHFWCLFAFMTWRLSLCKIIVTFSCLCEKKLTNVVNKVKAQLLCKMPLSFFLIFNYWIIKIKC